MPLLRITNGFDRLSDSDLEARTNSLIASITGNANFPTPTPTLAVVQAASDAFTSALAVAQTGSPYEKAVKNEKRTELIDLLHSMSNYVLFTANGDVLKAKSSGFTIAKEPTPAPALTAATNQRLQDGQNTGMLEYSFSKVPGARSYVYQCTPDPITENSKWESETGTISKALFSGLEIGRRYWCRVTAIGTKSQGVTSVPVSRIVQ